MALAAVRHRVAERVAQSKIAIQDVETTASRKELLSFLAESEAEKKSSGSSSLVSLTASRVKKKAVNRAPRYGEVDGEGAVVSPSSDDTDHSDESTNTLKNEKRVDDSFLQNEIVSGQLTTSHAPLPRGVTMGVSGMLLFLTDAAATHPTLCTRPLQLISHTLGSFEPQALAYLDYIPSDFSSSTSMSSTASSSSSSSSSLAALNDDSTLFQHAESLLTLFTRQNSAYLPESFNANDGKVFIIFFKSSVLAC
jgi:hypothetical protein